jgi:hypothetical protein
VQSDYIQRAVWIGKGMVLSAYMHRLVWRGPGHTARCAMLVLECDLGGRELGWVRVVVWWRGLSL